ncbi:M56 family metallopeptidase [Mucilaginibacter psychrotolerans]|uniref:M56 family metallopeptidase n=1 Tax=Mucilaginibacter psychrotolerans TaxID=1524096 RepID=A0A4Y8SBC4_9SPHI|nr:M56 family metallopeptidase [Mucilaginibacter psychrotolerans]TFF35951.1 M56 family metallopeptidase [Mucilaginibacter psychrotolerans]
MNWLHYLVEANIYLGVFYLCYCLFLNNETHYVLGRAYLLFSCVVSFVLPVTQLSMLKPVEQITLQPVAYTPPAVNGSHLPEITIDEPVAQITMPDVLFYAYIIGAAVTLIVLGYRLYRLSLLTRKSKSRYADKYKLIQLKGDNTAFSFFNYLFIGTEVPQADTIIAHELVHIRQRHSADIMFVELLKVVSWFNPFIYLLQRSLRTLHEYIADEQTAAQERDALTYSAFLLNNAYGIQGSPIAHSFFNYNLLKKRIIMLNQKRSGNLARLKYLAAVPLCVGMLCASTLVFSKNYAFIDLAPTKPVQAEIRIDEPITKTIKYFKTVDKVRDFTAYSDNLSFTHKGVKKVFFAKSVTPTELDYIKKTVNFTVEVIDVDSQTLMPVSAASDAKSDTTRKLPPPPPPAPAKPKKAAKLALSKAGTPPPPPPAPVKPKKASKSALSEAGTPPPPPPAPAKPKKAPKLALSNAGTPPPPPPVIVIDEPTSPPSPPSKTIDTVRNYRITHDKPRKTKRVKPVVVSYARNYNIVIDSPVVVTNTQISIKPKVKPVTTLNLKKVNVKTAPVLKLDIKIDSPATRKP